jgi:2-C-methyl-D-erythritol 4-phosphate cytidylyltransferase
LPKPIFKTGKWFWKHAAFFEKTFLIDEIAVVVNEHYIFMIEDMIQNEWTSEA